MRTRHPKTRRFGAELGLEPCFLVRCPDSVRRPRLLLPTEAQTPSTRPPGPRVWHTHAVPGGRTGTCGRFERCLCSPLWGVTTPANHGPRCGPSPDSQPLTCDAGPGRRCRVSAADDTRRPKLGFSLLGTSGPGGRSELRGARGPAYRPVLNPADEGACKGRSSLP